MAGAVMKKKSKMKEAVPAEKKEYKSVRAFRKQLQEANVISADVWKPTTAHVLIGRFRSFDPTVGKQSDGMHGSDV